MDEWEYYTTFMVADIERPGAREHLARRFPDVEAWVQYTPRAMMGELDALGQQGWELVHMEPIAGIKDNGAVMYRGHADGWANTYFCVFKRKKKS